MRRSKFVLSLLSVAPVAAFARLYKHSSREGKAFKVKAGEGRYHGHIQLKGVNANIIDVKISGRDTDGDLAIFEQTGISPKRGTPLHVHPNQDEVFYIVEGNYRFKAGDTILELSAGESIFLPRKLPHAWTQLSERGKMTVMLQPAGKLEDFFVTMAALTKEPTPKELVQLFRDHEMEIVGPPLEV
ncbi:cupin domain-containing protein [Agriterribacter humi]|uniref:cupin domain-containing protein n=1 Tax=Agriterribacter humi TaxID=1104781 RepID=UPI001264EFD9|nr:cupin domain-containing protein [Agriterribacter humi]